MKLFKLSDARFIAAFAKLTAQQMPLRAAFKLKGIATRIRQETANFDEVRKNALHEYGMRGEDGELLLDEHSNVKFEPEKLQKFLKDLNELGDMDVDVGTLSVGELGDKLSLTAEDVIALDGLLIE